MDAEDGQQRGRATIDSGDRDAVHVTTPAFSIASGLLVNLEISMIERLFTTRGRIARSTFWGITIGVAVLFTLLFAGMETLIGRSATLVLYPPLFWALYLLAARRYHDLGKSPARLLMPLIPIAGVIMVFYDLA